MINLPKVQSLIKQLEECPYLVINDEHYTPSCKVLGTPGDMEYEDEEIISFSWEDDFGQIFEIKISEKGLSEARITNNKIICKDMDKEEIEIKLFDLVPSPIRQI